MAIDFNRLLEQNKAIQAVVDANYNAAILGTVGFGKAKILLDLLKKLVDEGKVKNVLYLCDNTRLRDVDFPAEVEKWQPHLMKIIVFECYQTAHKFVNRKYDLVLGDEFDFALTKEYIKVFFNNAFTYKILVSGTLSAPKRKLAVKIVPIVYTLTTVEAEDKKLLNKTNYYLYNYKMSDEEAEEYNTVTRHMAKAAASGNPNWLNKVTSKRKELLFNLESTVTHSRKIMQWLWNKNKGTRVVVFAERTEQADKLCKWSYHGGNVKLENLNKFQSGEISGIAVVGKIKRGINLKNANSAIFSMVGGKSSTEVEQKNGRLKRLPVAEMAEVIFMIPWTYSIQNDKDGNKIKVWKPTIVDNWVYHGTINIKPEFKTLKL